MHRFQALATLLLVSGLMTAVSDPAAGQSTQSTAPSQSAAPINPFQGAYLLGDWGGSREQLLENGVTFDAIFTQFAQVQTEQIETTVSNYANKFDLFLNVDTGKAHLWKGGAIGVHAEIRDGEAPTGAALFPSNTALYTPTTGPLRFVLTSLYVTQKAGSATSLTFGLINAIDLYATAQFLGGRGIDGFMHIAFVAPPNGLTPVVTYGAIARTRIGKYGFSLFVFDPRDQTGFQYRPFKEGVNFNLSAARPVKVFGHNATHTLGGIFSTSKGTNLADIQQWLLPISDQEIGTRRGPFNISYQYEQYLYQNPSNPLQGWGLFVKVAVADGNPNLIQNSIVAGLGGSSVFRRRNLDRFGVGYFNYGLSDVLKNALLAPPLGLRVGNEAGAEVFYNYALTRWLRVTADMQVLPPTIDGRKTLVFGALRLKVSL